VTRGHKHRVTHIKSFDVWWVRLIRRPLAHTTDYARVDLSPYPYGSCTDGGGRDVRCRNAYRHPKPDCWYLTTFGILHRWTGLTLCNWPRPCPDHDPPEYEPHCGDETCDDDHTT